MYDCLAVTGFKFFFFPRTQMFISPPQDGFLFYIKKNSQQIMFDRILHSHTFIIMGFDRDVELLRI